MAWTQRSSTGSSISSPGARECVAGDVGAAGWGRVVGGLLFCAGVIMQSPHAGSRCTGVGSERCCSCAQGLRWLARWGLQCDLAALFLLLLKAIVA